MFVGCVGCVDLGIGCVVDVVGVGVGYGVDCDFFVVGICGGVGIWCGVGDFVCGMVLVVGGVDIVGYCFVCYFYCYYCIVDCVGFGMRCCWDDYVGCGNGVFF